MHKAVTKLLPSLLFLLTTSNLSATQVDPVTLEEAIRDAGMTFQGTVTKIESQVSTNINLGYEPLVYGFVGFRIDRTIKGEVEGGGNSITLQFEDCFVYQPEKQELFLKKYPTMEPVHLSYAMQPTMTTKHGGGMACHINGMPSFRVGESDILFTLKNLSHVSCPLIGWWQGRYSIINKSIYPVMWLNPNDTIDFAPYGIEEEEAAMKSGFAYPPWIRQFDWLPQKGAKRISPDQFADYLDRQVNKLTQAQFLARTSPPEPVKSADPTDLFIT